MLRYIGTHSGSCGRPHSTVVAVTPSKEIGHGELGTSCFHLFHYCVLLSRDSFAFHLCLCVCVCLSPCMCALSACGARAGHGIPQNPTELETLVGHPRPALGTQLRSSARATSILNAEPALHSSLPDFFPAAPPSPTPPPLSKTEVKPTACLSHLLCSRITSMCPHGPLTFYSLYDLNLVLALCLLLRFAGWGIEPTASGVPGEYAAAELWPRPALRLLFFFFLRQDQDWSWTSIASASQVVRIMHLTHQAQPDLLAVCWIISSIKCCEKSIMVII